MSRIVILVTTASVLLASAAPAAAPQFETPAKVAYLIDLSSGAVLYAKNADVRMPPASLAKMMTTEVAFELIDKGQLPLNKMCTVRPETWQKWHGPPPARPCSCRRTSRSASKICSRASSRCRATTRRSCLPNASPAPSRPSPGQMNDYGKRIGLTNSHFGTANGWPDNGVTYVSARDLATLARWEIEHHYKLYKEFYSLPSFTWGKTLGSNQDITQQNRNPILGHVAGADGLKTGHTDEAGYGFTGSAEQNGRRLIEVVAGLPSWNARVRNRRG